MSYSRTCQLTVWRNSTLACYKPKEKHNELLQTDIPSGKRLQCFFSLHLFCVRLLFPFLIPQRQLITQEGLPIFKALVCIRLSLPVSVLCSCLWQKTLFRIKCHNAWWQMLQKSQMHHLVKKSKMFLKNNNLLLHAMQST